MKRRDFIKKGIVAAGGALLSNRASSESSQTVRNVKTPDTNRNHGHYWPNRSPLAPTPFMKLPPGSVKPKGWLRHQLDLQVNGLCGRFPEISDYLQYDTCGWVDEDKPGWEELPYWLRGFGDLGYVTGDSRVLDLTKKWIEGIIATQRPDGSFGPKMILTALDGGPDFWPGMPLLDTMRSYEEYTGDTKIVPFLTNYFKFQNIQPAAVFNRGWGATRWGDNIDSVFWVYNRTGEAWLLDLAAKMHAGSADYVGGIPTWHNVNLSQGFREPAEFGQLAKDPKLRAATYRDYETILGQFGQFAGGGFAGDENCRPGFGDPRQGFETCGYVELMHSFEMLSRITGDPIWADRCEDIAINSLPAAFDPQQKGTHYITSANCVKMDNNQKHSHQFQNDFPMQAYMPGIHNYRCCPHNYGMGWPYYSEEQWLATSDRGLCASMYGANEVTAKVADGKLVTIAQETDYPFTDRIKFTVTGLSTPVAFPLYLRIPGWCSAARVLLNGKPVDRKPEPLSYVIIDRSWKTGDIVDLHLPMETTIRSWTKNRGSVSVNHGPITFSLLVGEKWNRFAGTEKWPEYEVAATTDWNYGLEIDEARPDKSFKIVHKPGALADNPFMHDTVPVELEARARKIPEWTADADGVVGLLEQGPTKTSEPIETITLIPMAAARLRITSFPVIGSGKDALEWGEHTVTVSASHVFDSLGAIQEGNKPSSSFDQSIPRFTWWDHRGTSEWIQYDYKMPKHVSAVSIYWYDDTGHGQCRVPKSWKLSYKDGDAWKPVETSGQYGCAKDAINRVEFKPVTTKALRVDVALDDQVSGGILTWDVETN